MCVKTVESGILLNLFSASFSDLTGGGTGGAEGAGADKDAHQTLIDTVGGVQLRTCQVMTFNS